MFGITFLATSFLKGLVIMCGQLRKCIRTHGTRTGADPPSRHYTDRVAFFVATFRLYKLWGLQMSSDEAKLFDRFSANDKQLHHIVTVKGPYGT